MFLHKFKPILICLIISLISLSSLEARKRSKTETAGDVIQITIPVTSLLIAFGKDDTEGMKQLFYSVAASTAATWGLKLAFNKKRPKGGKYSFPSGHTSLAFSGASFLGMRYGAAYGVPSIGAASYVGYTRVHARRHYWGDVIGGGIIGGLSGFLFTTPYQEVKKTEKQKTAENPELNNDESSANKKKLAILLVF